MAVADHAVGRRGDWPRHRHREFLRFLKTIDELDTATHKTPAVKGWLKQHSRFHLHFTPTSGSWLNMVECFFAEITRKRIRRGVFNSVDELNKPPSTISINTTIIPSPTFGPRPPPKSSVKSPVRNKRWNHSTRSAFSWFESYQAASASL
jgi:hypothetical protein